MGSQWVAGGQAGHMPVAIPVSSMSQVGEKEGEKTRGKKKRNRVHHQVHQGHQEKRNGETRGKRQRQKRHGEGGEYGMYIWYARGVMRGAQPRVPMNRDGTGRTRVEGSSNADEWGGDIYGGSMNNGQRPMINGQRRRSNAQRTIPEGRGEERLLGTPRFPLGNSFQQLLCRFPNLAL